MCLILFAVNMSDDYPLILAANRDEYYNRPTRPMAFWSESPDILAGKDLQAGGTWFGVHRQGRFAALTNYRDLSRVKPNTPSRGELIPNLLAFSGPISDYLSVLDRTAKQYSGFNLLAGEAGGPVFCYSNQTRKTTRVDPGIHGLSNHLLDTPWPKVRFGKKGLQDCIEKAPGKEAPLFALLADTRHPDDTELPDTGIGLEWERLLSPLFIQSDTYGTRSSTLMHIGKTGDIRITERNWWAGGGAEADRRFSLEAANPIHREDIK